MLFWHLVLHCNTCILCCCSIFFHICILCNHSTLLITTTSQGPQPLLWCTILLGNLATSQPTCCWVRLVSRKRQNQTSIFFILLLAFHAIATCFPREFFFATMVIYNERSLTIDNQFYSLAVHDPNTFSIFTSPLHFLFWKSHSRPPVIKWIQRLSCK